MNIQSFQTITFMSLCGAIGMLGVLFFTLGKEPAALEPLIAWDAMDISPRPAIYSKCDGTVQVGISVIEVVKKEKGTVITVRSYVPEVSRDLSFLTEFASDPDILRQREAFCWRRNREDPSKISESNGRWGPV
ncbi:hypothetical protein [Candidatus Nitrospira allomarina]|uniref:Uncharacterized protein n=1 Tax=Candidatus Nitrospira allomarina TaxID=3020900 RepID=A0AA96JSR7_9BACT|nr:hypothetical protein [Candidatus Nitrospira allomarina]WNM58380.1 hypothetical protein PP769_01050 [Candidatus Nitrospira allomarina]